MRQFWTAEELARLSELTKQGLNFGEIGKLMGRSRASVDNQTRRQQLQPAKAICPVATEQSPPVPPGDACKIEGSDESRFIETLSTRIVTLDDALAKAEVDRELWDVERFVVNSWEVGAKGPDGRLVVAPLWQVKVWLKRKGGWTPSEFRQKLLEQMRDASPKGGGARRHVAAARGERFLYEISIFDHHVGKLCWKPETGENYDIRIAEATYMQAVEDLLDRAAPYGIEKILFPIGNDFLHADNARNTTTGGTPQDVDGRWQKAFLYARRMVVAAVMRLREVAPVDVVVIPGNHDHERMFYLGDAVDGWLHRTKGVTVDNRPQQRKYYAYGKTLLGFTHGNEEKHADLPSLMAHEVPELWAKATHREIHLGHLHKRKMMNFVTTDTHGATVVRILPSLAATDAWHASKGYRAGRASEAYLWSRDGYAGHFSVSAKGE